MLIKYIYLPEVDIQLSTSDEISWRGLLTALIMFEQWLLHLGYFLEVVLLRRKVLRFFLQSQTSLQPLHLSRMNLQIDIIDMVNSIGFD